MSLQPDGRRVDLSQGGGHFMAQPFLPRNVRLSDVRQAVQVDVDANRKGMSYQCSVRDRLLGFETDYLGREFQ